MKTLLFLLFSNILFAQTVTEKKPPQSAETPVYDMGEKNVNLNKNDVNNKDQTIYTDAEKRPEYPGGIDAFRSKVYHIFDSSVLKEDKGIIKTDVAFVVETDGTISDIKASGSSQSFNLEIIRTIRMIKNKWAPALLNGKPVRYMFRLPLTMTFIE